MDERTRRWERVAAAEGPGGLVRLALERLRAGARDEALTALQGVARPDALALVAELLVGLERLEEAWLAAVAAVRQDPSALASEVAVPLAARLLAQGRARSAADKDELPALAALRRAADLGDAALDAVAPAAEDPDPLARGLAARVPALRAVLLTDPDPYVRFMARSPRPEARACAWRPLAEVELELEAGQARIALPPGAAGHHLAIELQPGELELLEVRVRDERGHTHEALRPVANRPAARAVCPIPGRGAQAHEVELRFRPGAGVGRVRVSGDDTRPTATRLFGAHGPDFETGLTLDLETRYPARLAFFSRDFLRRVDRLLTGREDHLAAYGSTYGLGFGPQHPQGGVFERVRAANRGGVLPFHVEVTGPRPFDHLHGLAPSDTLGADDERLARRFAQDLRGHPARLETPGPAAELHTRILGLFPPGQVPAPAELDPLLDLARQEYGPVGYRAVEAFVERASAERAKGVALGASLARQPLRRPRPEEDQR